MIQCLAIDDEPLALELLEDNISKVPFLKLVAGCDNAIDAMQIMQHQPVDLIFLDIQMPGLTGIQFLQSMQAPPLVILITAYEKYALEGFNLDVTDYLVKPVPLDRFIKACNKAKQLFDLRLQQNSVGASVSASFFFVNVDYSLVKVTFSDIVYVEGLKDYIKIHLKSTQRPLVTRMPMKTIEEQLPINDFIRIHKSYIVSVAFITAVRKSGVFIDTLELPVGDSYRDALNNLTGKF
jgi:two-component system, LytTR family, response regulator